MSTLIAALRLDFRLQRRYGFYYAAVFAAAIWVALLVLLPDGLIAAGMPYVIFGDLGIVGFFFIVGALFLEKGERTLSALIVTPLRFGDYLAAKLTSMTVLALVVSLFVAVGTYGIGFRPVEFVLGVVLTSLVMMLIAFVTAAPYPSISEWLMPAMGPLLILNVPLLDYSGLWPQPLLQLIPSEGGLLLLGVAFGQVTLSPWEYAAAIGYPLVWIAGLSVLARRMFFLHIVMREGSA